VWAASVWPPRHPQVGKKGEVEEQRRNDRKKKEMGEKKEESS
jgi:hypothetical protein